MAYNIITPGGQAWGELLISASATKTGGTNDPVFAQWQNDGSSSTGVYSYQFNGMSENELFFQLQLPSSYKEGTNIYPHVHWSPTVSGTTGSGVVWGLEYTVATLSGTWPTTSFLYVESTVSGNLKHQVAEFPLISGSSFGVSTMISCRIFRDPIHPNDNYESYATLHGIGFLFLQDTSGSKERYSK